MEKKCEEIYYYICYHKLAFGFAPAREKVAEVCNTSVQRVEYWLNKLKNRGVIKLYVFDDGSYDVKIMIDPLRRWKANLIVHAGGVQLLSEIPLQLFCWDGQGLAPKIHLSEPMEMKR